MLQLSPLEHAMSHLIARISCIQRDVHLSLRKCHTLSARHLRTWCLLRYTPVCNCIAQLNLNSLLHFWTSEDGKFNTNDCVSNMEALYFACHIWDLEQACLCCFQVDQFSPESRICTFHLEEFYLASFPYPAHLQLSILHYCQAMSASLFWLVPLHNLE